MKTPAGKECPHYYADFHRGRNREECRLLDANRDSPAWTQRDCFGCPVPDILRANASDHLRLRARVTFGFLGFGRRVEVDAYCEKHTRPVDDPYVGCPACAAERPNISDLLLGSE